MESVIARFDQEKAQAEATLNRPQNRVIRDRSRFLSKLDQAVNAVRRAHPE